jgi:hypothetical protein
MAINTDLLAPCGLYCGVCAVYIATRDGNTRLKARLAALYAGGTPGKGALPNSQGLTSEEIHCGGCLSDDRFMHCRQCDIRACARDKGIPGCHACDAFPCRHIEHFPMTVGRMVILRSVPHRREFGTEQWAQEEEARYLCPHCGKRAFRGAMRCNGCKAQLDLD